MATNELDAEKLSDAEILREYKGQGTESKFIKDDAFELDSVFLKTPERISALMMIMTVCLMIYGVSQHDLRSLLQKNDQTLPDQQRKPTKNPSMKWIYYLFSGVHELSIYMPDSVQNIVINVNKVLKNILEYFGARAKEIYLN